MTLSIRTLGALAAASTLVFAAGCSDDDTSGATDTRVDDADVAVDPDALAIDDTDGTSPPDDALTGWDGQRYGPGELGDPCFHNGDCNSSLCIEGPDGPICTRTCLESCPEGYSCRGVAGQTDATFICQPNVLAFCGSCLDDRHCFGGRCVDDGEQPPYCTRACEDDDACPDGYGCEDVTDTASGTTLAACVPESGTCGCTAGSLGAVRPCQRTNAFGACSGVQACEAGGWGTCTAREPAPEACDYQDNDCDGLVDEGFLSEAGIYEGDAHCGVCGNDCAGAIANAVTSCDAALEPPQCVVDACAAGFFQVSPFYCGSIPARLCSPCESDQTCVVAGGACNALEGGSFCTVPCATADDCPNGYDCVALGGSLQCVPESGSCQCDAEAQGLQRACEQTYQDPQNPQAPVVTCVGLETCGEDGWSMCALGEEVCDYIDNDCDGAVDEGFVDDGGRYFRDTDCGVCGNNCLAAGAPPNSTAKCDVGGPVPACGFDCLEGTADVNGNPADGCECVVTSAVDLPDGTDANCDGVDGEVDNAVFVAKTGADANPGTIDAPKRTLQAAIDAAETGGLRDVYVATGVYTENIVLAPGVVVYGGYSGDFRDRDTALFETAILGVEPTAGLPAAVNAFAITGEAGSAGLVGFSVFGWINRDPGGSSYGIRLVDCDDAVVVRDNRVVAGSGGDGAAGAQGDPGASGAAGQPGLAAVDLGKDTCAAADHRAGGVGGAHTCGGVGVGGGAGGTAVCPDFNESVGQTACPVNSQQTASPASAGTSGSGPGAGVGGPGGFDRYINAIDGPFSDPVCTAAAANCTLCKTPPEATTGEAGDPGAAGASGVAGSGCAGGGQVVDGLWLPGAGAGGGDGGAGAGGGGGGAAGGVETWGCPTEVGGFHDLGGSGGGGGGGGCGGLGGGGGTGGGGSFGIFVAWSSAPASAPTIVGNTIVRGAGGDGGAGGTGGTGGGGGAGGAGGAATQGNATFCTAAGGTGGNGGVGGHGAGGGGGCGGPSYGLFAAGAAAPAAWRTQNDFATAGAAGRAGAGGLSLGEVGAEGAPGAEGDTNF